MRSAVSQLRRREIIEKAVVWPSPKGQTGGKKALQSEGEVFVEDPDMSRGLGHLKNWS